MSESEIPRDIQVIQQKDAPLRDKLREAISKGYRNPKDLKKWFNASKTYVYSAIAEIKASSGQLAESSDISVETAESKTPTLEPAPELPPPPSPETEDKTSMAVAKLAGGGLLESGELEALLSIPAEFYPDKYKPSQKTLSAVAKLGTRPINRLIEKYATENIDLYIFAMSLGLAFGVPAIRWANDSRQQREPPAPKQLSPAA